MTDPDRLAALESRVAKLERSPESLRCQLTATQQLLQERTAERDALLEQVDLLQRETDKVHDNYMYAADGRLKTETELDDIRVRLGVTQAELDETQHAHLGSLAKIDALQANLAAMKAERDALQANLQDIIEERDHLLAVEVQHETDLAAMTDERDAALAEIATLQMDLRILRDEASVTVADRERLRDKLDALRTREPTDYELSQVVCVAIDGARNVWRYVREALLSGGKWTRTPPTEPGWYWYSAYGRHSAVPVHIIRGLVLFGGNWITTTLDAEWAGPITMPEEEQP